MLEEPEVPTGFIVGTVNEPGYCEVCRAKLRVGRRAAIWNPTSELFCLDCAKAVGGEEEPDDVVWSLVIPMIVLAALFLLLILGLAQ